NARENEPRRARPMAAYLTLLITAAIWGFAFVAQRKGMESLDPFTFNALRFGLGALCVWAFSLLPRIRDRKPGAANPGPGPRNSWKGPLLLGALLFVAVSFQQIGMLWTGAGSAGFITGLYVVFVPLIGLGRGQKLNSLMIVAVALSLAGLAFINGKPSLQATLGNALVLVGAVFWALHVQLIDKLTKTRSSLRLARIQYWLCALLSLAGSLIYRAAVRKPVWDLALWKSIQAAGLPLLYAGIMSVAVAFTLQLHAQKKVQPHAASVILCLEGAFAMFGGWLLLGEKVSASALLGAALLLAAMLVSVSRERREFLIDKKTLPKT
ncbi:MAG: DMT family transporter, partial [Candidatus Cloacimonadaceae bacterium]